MSKMPEHGNGPFRDSWKLVAKMPIRRIQDPNASEAMSGLVIPFAGERDTPRRGWGGLFVSGLVSRGDVRFPRSCRLPCCHSCKG
ncbi:hypothetical protein DCS_00112 [Drechmeria coniospora]|uniref:Uncharacterized protein n=1 Tax=Drechmeria coniospora TaxID=98403 RepID=A0A151GPE0_DRECN|nr:hypothetical protein DCS_00112 [Drechmeria coniospora]KYK58985.1 hypothetical protein DCS_00112 [Drechmeria coniospora]